MADVGPPGKSDPPRAFGERLAAGLAGLAGAELVAVYLHGSAALGGWIAARSDVDLLVVVADQITPTTVAATGEELAAAAAGCPGRGLECSVVTAGQAGRPAPPWPFLLHVAVRAGRPAVLRGGPRAGDPDLLMHYTVCRAAGIALAGPPPGAVIGPVGRPAILAYLAGELHWGLANAPESYCVLNACRALVYLRDGAIVSKVSGGRAALGRRLGPAGLIRRALDQQEARAAEQPAAADAGAFVQEVSMALGAAARQQR